MPRRRTSNLILCWMLLGIIVSGGAAVAQALAVVVYDTAILGCPPPSSDWDTCDEPYDRFFSGARWATFVAPEPSAGGMAAAALSTTAAMARRRSR